MTQVDRASRRKANWLRTALVGAASILLACIALIAGALLWAHHRIVATETVPHNLASPRDGYWIHSHDLRVHFREWGARDGKPLLLVHGAGGWSGTWAGNAEAMAAAGYRVIAMDLPPFGFSDLPTNADYSRLTQARRIQAVVERMGPQPVTLVAHAYGGGPALEAAMLVPQRIAQLVLVDAAIGLQPENPPPCKVPWLVRTVFASPALRTALIGATATEPHLTAYWLRRLVAHQESITPERVALYQRPFVGEDFSVAVADWARQQATGCERPASVQPRNLRALAVPVSLLWGEQDTSTPLSEAQALKALLPRARLTVLQGVGHIPQIEDAARFDAAMAEALRSPP